ncbi:hypothetical protein CEXT_180091, partial [Caerostris extrusa]
VTKSSSHRDCKEARILSKLGKMVDRRPVDYRFIIALFICWISESPGRSIRGAHRRARGRLHSAISF